MKTNFDHYYITNLTEQLIQFSKFAVCAGHEFSNHPNYTVVHEMHEKNVMTSNHSHCDNQRFKTQKIQEISIQRYVEFSRDTERAIMIE